MSLPLHDAQTLPACVAFFAEQNPKGVALRQKDMGIWKNISWQEYYDHMAAVGHGLKLLGIEPADHIGILSENCPEWLYADLGGQGIGARAVGIYQTNPSNDVAYVVEHAGIKVLFVEDQEQCDKALEIVDDIPCLEHIIIFDPRGTRHYDHPKLQHWSSFLDAGMKDYSANKDWFAEEIRTRDPHAPAMVVYTSGTTGRPKGAMLSSHNVLELSKQSTPLLGVEAGDTLLSYLPLCHVAEKIFSLFLPLRVGAVVHFGESIETVREDLREVSPTVFLGVPRIWEKMQASIVLRMQDSSWLKRTLFHFFTRFGQEMQQRKRQGQSGLIDKALWFVGDLLVYRPLQERMGLRRCKIPISGAAPIAPELLEWFYGVGIPILEGYGQTECSGVSHLNPPSKATLGSVGQVLPGVEFKTAEDGEILVRSPSVFAGYLHDEKATSETVDSDGWLHTGDVGKEDKNGFLFITGRKKEIIITAGGKNISPEHIENILKLSPFIKEAVAIGDRRKFISALIQIDDEAVGDWANRRSIDYTSFEDLSAKEEVVSLIDEEVERLNEKMARVEAVRSFRLFEQPLHQDNGELTATQKVRRKSVEQIHAGLIESMYGGGA